MPGMLSHKKEFASDYLYKELGDNFGYCSATLLFSNLDFADSGFPQNWRPGSKEWLQLIELQALIFPLATIQLGR
jgi:hypothetical protein